MVIWDETGLFRDEKKGLHSLLLNKYDLLINGQTSFLTENDGSVVGLVAGGEAETNGIIIFLHHVEDGLLYGFAEWVGVVVDVGQTAYDQGFQVLEFAGPLQGVHHALHMVDVFIHFLDKEYPPLGLRERIGAQHATQYGQIAAYNHAFGFTGSIQGMGGPFVMQWLARQGVDQRL